MKQLLIDNSPIYILEPQVIDGSITKFTKNSLLKLNDAGEIVSAEDGLDYISLSNLQQQLTSNLSGKIFDQWIMTVRGMLFNSRWDGIIFNHSFIAASSKVNITREGYQYTINFPNAINDLYCTKPTYIFPPFPLNAYSTFVVGATTIGKNLAITNVSGIYFTAQLINDNNTAMETTSGISANGHLLGVRREPQESPTFTNTENGFQTILDTYLAAQEDGVYFAPVSGGFNDNKNSNTYINLSDSYITSNADKMPSIYQTTEQPIYHFNKTALLNVLLSGITYDASPYATCTGTRSNPVKFDVDTLATDFTDATLFVEDDDTIYNENDIVYTENDQGIKIYYKYIASESDTSNNILDTDFWERCYGYNTQQYAWLNELLYGANDDCVVCYTKNIFDFGLKDLFSLEHAFGGPTYDIGISSTKTIYYILPIFWYLHVTNANACTIFYNKDEAAAGDFIVFQSYNSQMYDYISTMYFITEIDGQKYVYDVSGDENSDPKDMIHTVILDDTLYNKYDNHYFVRIKMS